MYYCTSQQDLDEFQCLVLLTRWAKSEPGLEDGTDAPLLLSLDQAMQVRGRGCWGVVCFYLVGQAEAPSPVCCYACPGLPRCCSTTTRSACYSSNACSSCSCKVRGACERVGPSPQCTIRGMHACEATDPHLFYL